MDTPPLDRAVKAARNDLDFGGLPAPQALLLLGTGVGALKDRLRGGDALPLERVAGVPPPWTRCALHHGRLEREDPLEGRGGALSVWVLEDVSGDAGEPGSAAAPAWARGFPCWLAARAGAELLLHVSAGAALSSGDRAPAVPTGGIAVLSDHLNLSGESPLLGLGPSRLGPLFPDLTRLHDAGLRRAALAELERVGVAAGEAVAACTPGPTRDTPAERAFYASAGADVAVQGLAAPLLAAAHAGLTVLALVAVVEAGEGPLDVSAVVSRAQGLAPVLDELFVSLVGELARTASARAAPVDPS